MATVPAGKWINQTIISFNFDPTLYLSCECRYINQYVYLLNYQKLYYIYALMYGLAITTI